MSLEQGFWQCATILRGLNNEREAEPICLNQLTWPGRLPMTARRKWTPVYLVISFDGYVIE